LAAELQVPESYDEYYAAATRVAIRYLAPISAALFILFFGWDLLLIHSATQGQLTLAVRVFAAACWITVWFVAPKVRSLRVLELMVAAMYLISFLDVTALLVIVPRGLTVGVAGLMLVIMVAGSMFCQRTIVVGITGLLCIISLAATYSLSGATLQETAIALIFVASGCVASLVFAFAVHRELRQKHTLELSLSREKQQTDTLLKEILPRYVIQRIRDGADSIAESIAEVNIIFIDMVGFTAMARRLAPTHLIEVLGGIFRSLDELCEQHGVTKIKTIGDAYMAATGAPEPSSLSAQSAVEFCLSAIESVRQTALRTGIPLQIRTGIATGAAISGVLSLKRPAYDLWGETVNLASRMENTAEPGSVQIAETTYWRVKDRFMCVPRGLVDVKGFGQVQTYVIAGRSQEDAADEHGTTTSTLL
jgi:class 3 adenylate cyclase